MARPQKDPADFKGEQIKIPLTVDQKRQIVAAAVASGRDTAAWAREVLLAVSRVLNDPSCPPAAFSFLEILKHQIGGGAGSAWRQAAETDQRLASAITSTLSPDQRDAARAVSADVGGQTGGGPSAIHSALRTGAGHGKKES
jgi:hypothetical protein